MDAIPDGWALCNGENGTPDLRDKFVLGAGAAYAVGDAGGEESHRLTINEMPSHSHSYIKYYTTKKVASSTTANYANYSSISQNTGTTGGGSAHNNMPPYYALAYIMKL